MLSVLRPESWAQVVSSSPPGKSNELSAWQHSMTKLPLPHKGCFTAKFPSTALVQTACKLAPPYRGTVGGGNDSMAEVSSGSITSATGTFQNVTVTGERTLHARATNDFSLQLNTNSFTTNTSNGFIANQLGNVCQTDSGPACVGVEQFYLANFASFPPVGTNLYMQFWLLGYYQDFGACPGSQIPGGWESGIAGQWRQSGNDCFINGPAVSVPILSISDLSQLIMTGTVDQNGLDVAMLVDHDQLYTIGLPTNFLGMNQSWNQAEFNVFGLWMGYQAEFNPGTTITVVTAVEGSPGASTSASCLTSGISLETNNLNLWPCSCFANGGEITFTESNASSPTCACPSNSTWNPGASSCACNVTGQVINNGQCTCQVNGAVPINGICGCPAAGQIVANNQCTCSVKGAVPINGTCGCPATGQIVVNNQCTCSVKGAVPINNACGCPAFGQTVVHNTCTCPPGQSPRELNGTLQCACPGNQLYINGTCGCGQLNSQVVVEGNNCVCPKGTSPAVNSFGTGYVCVAPPGNGAGNPCPYGAYLCNCGRNGWGPCPPKYGTNSSPAAQTDRPAANHDPERVKMRVAPDWNVLGRDDAPVTVVEFSDYQCPFCRRFEADSFAQLKRDYIDTGKVRFVSRDLPLGFHANAQTAAIAARCAGEQHKFWEMRSAMMLDSATDLGPESILKYGLRADLEMDAFAGCIKDKKYISAIQKDVADASALGVGGTPSFVIGKTAKDEIDGVRIDGAVPYAVFNSTINDLLLSK